jgi:5'-3' exonuclease
MKFKCLTENKNWHGDPEKDLFCKIVAGDKSDNISSVFPRCGLKTAAKYYDNRAEFTRKLESVEGAKERYLRNQTLIDFAYIPEELCVELRAHICAILPKPP